MIKVEFAILSEDDLSLCWFKAAFKEGEEFFFLIV